ncbi:MAG: hypothetical protein HND52_06015 [Ignavibacteriae bacterium]|nr:hypothetical protein [Ignavibacteriota bacterium]NOG97500.1 hypothetical protein [Ignavibacteriota bacterium]
MKYIKFIIILLVTNFTINSYAQSNEETIIADLESSFMQYNEFYSCYVFFLDSLMGSYDNIGLYKFEDINKSLENCVFFVAEKFDPKDSTIVGIYKDGNILWQSEPIIFGGYVEIILVRDINMDTKTDIAIKVWDGMYTEWVWIFSWDGVRCDIINDITADDYYPGETKSKLIGDLNSFGFCDYEGDGILEIICGKASITNGYGVYSWNGNLYGEWASTPEIPENFLFPANNLTAKCNTYVTKNNNQFVYYYELSNDSTSVQNIASFDLYPTVCFESTQSPPGWFGGSGNAQPLTGWTTIFRPERLIFPGDTLDGYIIKCSKLPKIVDYYIQGHTREASNPIEGPEITQVDLLTDLFNNSFHGKTIAPGDSIVYFIATEFIDTLKSYNNQSYDLGWIQTQEERDKYNTYFNNTSNYLSQNNNNAAKSELQIVLNECNTDSSTVLTSEAYALLYFNTEYLIEQIPDTEPGLPVKLQDSQGNLLQGGSLQYYDGSWMDAVNNGNGTFNVITERITVSIRMTYEGGNQQFNNVPVGPDTVTFQTVNSTVKLLNSLNEPLADPSADGTVQFYAGSWREFGTIINGEVTKELLPRQYSFRMTYGGANNDKQQNIGDDPVVVFQTVNSTVQLLDSQGNLIQEEGIVQYYAGSWRTFGTTTSGTVSNELLPKSYSFRMTHEGVNNDKQQDIGVEDTVSFSTVFCVVQVKDSQNQPVDGAEVKYYSGSWRDIGLTANGEVNKELLPKNLTFRVIHNGVVQNKQQDIGTNNIVEFVVE